MSDEADRSGLTIERDRAALLVIDIQERLCAAMPDEVSQRAVRNVVVLIEMARRFGVPIVVSQQYPQGLGPTVAAVEQALAAVSGVHRLDKVEFSVCAAPAFAPVAEALGARTQWIVTGMETHVCVYQTVRQLRGGGASVHVVSDAVVSRHKPSFRAGIDLMARTGAVITTTEIVVFDALGRAGGDDFKALSRLIR